MSEQTNPQVNPQPQSTVVKPVLKKRKKSRKKLFIIGGIILLILIVITVVISSKKEPAIEVQTEKISRMNITQVVQATGKIQSEVQVNISSEVSGEVISLPFKEGDEVKSGALLVRIRPDAYIPQLQQQVANVKVQESALAEQEVQLQRFELELSRTKELVTKGLASQSELDNAQSNYDQALATVGRVRAQISQTQAALSSVQYDISKTSIFAPISGTVTALNNEVGEKVLGTSFNIGSNIMTISDLNKMECQVEVGETDVTLINLGDTASIEIDAFPDKILKGYVYEVGNSAVSKATGTQEEVVNFLVKIRIINNDVDLRPGMSCNVDIEVAKKDNVLGVPIQSVTVREDFNKQADNTDTGNENLMRTQDVDKKKIKPQEVVFIVEGGVSKLKNVKTGISNDTYIEVTEGVTEGEEVVKGSFKAISKELENDTKVKVNNDVKKKSPDEES